MKKLLVIVLLMISAISFSQEKVLLRYNFKKGDTYKVEMKMLNDMGNSNSIEMNFTMDQEVKSVDSKGVYSSEAKISRIVANMKQSGVSVNYDSNKKEEELDQMGKMIKPQMDKVLKTKIFLKVNAIGEILEAKTEPSLPQTNNLTSQTNIIYPKEAVKVGDTWSSTRKENGLDFNFTYKVISITRDKVALDVTGTLSGAGTGSIKGKVNVDKETGVSLDSSLNMDINVQGTKVGTNIVLKTTKL